MTSKTLPFDLELAQSGVAVCLADGTPVEIVNFNLTTVCGSYPILGRYTDRAGEDHYEIWPASGTFADEPGHADAPQDLCLVASQAQDGEPDETDYEAELDYQGQVNALRDELAEARHTIAEHVKELGKTRQKYATATVKINGARNLSAKIIELEQIVSKERREYRAASVEADKMRIELDASRQNYAAATLGIKELQDVVDKERRERIRLEQWQKEALVSIKDWAQVETYIDKTAKVRDLGKDRSAIVLDRLRTLTDLEGMLKKIV